MAYADDRYTTKLSMNSKEFLVSNNIFQQRTIRLTFYQ